MAAIQLTLGGGTDAFVAKLADTTQPAPSILQNGIVNAASYRLATDPNGAVAAGSIVAIFGNNLAPASRSATLLPLPTTLFDSTVTFTEWRRRSSMSPAPRSMPKCHLKRPPAR